MSQMLCRLATVLNPGDVKFLYDDEALKLKVFSIRTPITDTETQFTVTNEQWHNKIIPEDVLALVEYIQQMNYILEHAREEQPFDIDLRPTSEEEKRIFGVRAGRDNACLPKSLYYQDIVQREMGKAMDKMKNSMDATLYGFSGIARSAQAALDGLKRTGIRV